MKKTAAKRSQAGSVAYATFLLIYIVAVLAVGYYFLTKLWSYAEEYEISRPARTLDAYVAELNDNQWNEGLAQTVAAMPHEFQTDEEVAQIIRDQFSGKITYARTSGGDEHTRNYSIRAGDREIGKIQIAEDLSQPSRYGMYPWHVVNEEFDFTGLYSSVEITVPKTYTVTLNDRAMGEEYIAEDNIHFALLEDYYDGYPDLPVKVTYSFDHVIGSLAPVVYDVEGNRVEVDAAAGDEQFLNNCTEEELARVSDFLGRFADHYARYTSGLGDDAAASYNRWLRGYIVADSDLARRMIAAQDGLFWTRTYSVEILSFEVGNIISFGNGIYLCDYTDEVKVVRSGGTDINDNNVRVMVVETDGDMRVLEYNQF